MSLTLQWPERTEGGASHRGPRADHVIDGDLRRDRRRRIPVWRHRRLTAGVAAVGLVLVAVILRLVNITTSYDLFIDEATYAAIARDATLATGPLLHGSPFVLHPPIALMLLAGPTHLIGTGEVDALVAGLRPVVALTGALSVVVIFAALYRAGLRKAAFVAAAFVALDPFTISFDSRVMLEAFAQLFAVLTIAAAIRSATADARIRWRWTALIALAGAATFGTKETFGLVVLAALVLIALTSARGNRRAPSVAVAGTLVGYALVNVAMIGWAGPSLWWHMRTDGLSRLLGTQQSTGFKAEGAHGSFWDRLLPNALELGATYAVLVIGGICALALLWTVLRARPSVATLAPNARAAVRIVAIWAVCACGYIGYAVVFGSLEEQMFYIAFMPCAAAVAIQLFLIRRRALRRAGMVGVAAVVLVQSVVWVQVHSTRDDAYAQMLAGIEDVAPVGSTMAVTEETAQFVVDGYELGQWASVADLSTHGVEYVLMSDRLVEHGYGLADAEFADAVRQNGTLVLSVQGRKNDLQVYDVREWTSAGQLTPSTTGGRS